MGGGGESGRSGYHPPPPPPPPPPAKRAGLARLMGRGGGRGDRVRDGLAGRRGGRGRGWWYVWAGFQVYVCMCGRGVDQQFSVYYLFILNFPTLNCLHFKPKLFSF